MGRIGRMMDMMEGKREAEEMVMVMVMEKEE